MQRRVFFSVVILLSVSMVVVYSLTTYTVIAHNYQGFHFFARQFFVVAVSILFMWILSQCDIDKIFKPMGWFVLFGSAVLLIILPMLPEGLASSAGGAKRWIRLGFFSLAPLEFFKIGFIFFLSWSFSRRFFEVRRTRTKEEILKFIPYAIVFAVFAMCSIGLQNDLGQVVLLGLIMCVMLMLAGGSLKFLGILISAVIVCGVIAISTSETRMFRFSSWWMSGPQEIVYSILPDVLTKWIDMNQYVELPEPYQIYHAGNAIYNGGILGNGIGEGVIKLGFLSEVHTDMVFAGLAEEWGFLGVLIVLGIFFFGIFYPILWIANRANNHMHFLFCVGIAATLTLSIFINAFGVLGVIPLKGIAVPFLSYGGSSILANCLAIGLVLSIARKNIMQSGV